MIRIVKLLLPALIPAWNFFDIIAPSPRIQFALLNAEGDEPVEWTEFRQRPARVSLFTMLWRMIWNPLWNESLFVMSCAERILEHPTEHSENEILHRIAADLGREHNFDVAGRFLQFRLLLVQREGEQLQQELVFQSQIKPLSSLVAR